MKYPESFIERLSQEFPEEKDLSRQLKDGSPDVKEFLEWATAVPIWMTPEEIIKAIDEGREAEVRASAEKSIRVCKLAVEWQEIFDANPPGFVELVTGYPPERS